MATTTAPAKKTVKPKPLKLGTKVRWTRLNGKIAEGRVDGFDDKANGRWVAVNTAPKGQNREITEVQQGRLTVIG